MRAWSGLAIVGLLLLGGCGTVDAPENGDAVAVDDSALAELEAALQAAEDRAEAAETRAERAEARLEELERQLQELTALLEGAPPGDSTVVDEGQPARIGDLRILVLGAQCMNGFRIEYEFMEDEEHMAQGQFCAIRLQIENVGEQPTGFAADWDHLVVDTEGRTHASAPEEYTFNDEHDAYFGQLNPGQSGEVQVLFDIPRDVTPVELVFREWLHEAEVRIALPEPEWIGEGTVEWQE